MRKRLQEFYEALDTIMMEEVWSIDNSIEDGEMEESERGTYESYGSDIYFMLTAVKDFKFLTKDFILQEIYKYFNKKYYWSEIRQKYQFE